MEIWFNYFNLMLIFVVFALSLNLLLGYAGQVSVAHASFGAVGGYSVGYLATVHHWNFVPGLAVGMFLALVFGIAVALCALKLSVEYIILLTLAVSSVILGVFSTFSQLGGSYGLIGIPVPDLFGWKMQNPRDWVIPLFVVAVLVYLFCWRLGESPFGRVLKGVREDDRATEALGKSTFRYKVMVFAIASMLAGLAGGLYSSYLHLATPGVFGFSISLVIFAMVIFGGMANLTGSVLGAIVVQGSQPLLERVVKLSPERAGFVRLAAYGLLLLVLMRLRPQGVLPEGFSLWHRLRHGGPKRGRIEMVKDVVAPVVLFRGFDEHIQHSDAEPSHENQVAREEAWGASSLVLQVRGLTKHFGGIIAAEDLSMDLHKGTITALVGPNGAGKTTVFNLLTGYIKPDQGSVLLNGVDLIGHPPNEVARRGMVRSFQDVRLFMRLSCLQNVSMAVQNQPGEHLGSLFFSPRSVKEAETATKDKALDWLRFVGMEQFADVAAGSLSYGQSKLIALARVLATEADVLLLDEPASGIDTQWVEAMLTLIESLRSKGRTICIVEHNLHVVGRLADHTYFMELGRITAQGTIEELTTAPRLAAAYFGTA